MEDEIERYISQKERDAMPTGDFAGHGTDFPIPDQAHLDAAVKDLGRESPEYQASIKKRIIEIAQRKGLSLPESWQEEDGREERMAGKTEPGEIERSVIDGLPDTFTLYVPFTRVSPDDERREIVGIATKEVLDSHGTIISYEASKKAFERWFGVGNVREQHDSKRAIGKALQWTPDDENKQIFVRAYISRSADGENTWTKIKEGILTGFSIAGVNAKYKTIQRDSKSVPFIDEFEMPELSIVDNPSCPVGPVALVRATGTVDGVLASDEEVTALLQKEQQTVAQNETPAQESFERAGARVSHVTQDALHSMRDNQLFAAKGTMDLCGCDECAAGAAKLDPDNDGDIDILTSTDYDGDGGAMERIERMIGQSMNTVYARMQAYLGEFSRRQSDTSTLQSVVERIAGNLEQTANKAEVSEQMDKVLAELAAVKGLFERVAKTPLPGGPHTGRSASKHLATDGSASPSGEEAPDLLRQINASGVQLTAQQQALIVAGSLKRM